MKIGIIGGSGLIGSYITQKFSTSHEVILFSRKNSLSVEFKNKENITLRQMNEPDPGKLQNLDILINLVGEPILGGRWTEERKKKLYASRVDYTKKLVKALEGIPKKPYMLVNGSAIGYYGMHKGDESGFSEDSVYGEDFLSSMCKDWEEEALQAKTLGIDVKLLRTGIVLSAKGGALKQMLTPFKFGLGGPIGNGKQYLSWIHIEDFVRAVEFLISKPSIQKVHFNMCSPEPSTNETFSYTLGEVLKRPVFLRVPSFALELLYGDGSLAVTLGQKVYPKNLIAEGFNFKFPQLKDALDDILKNDL